MAHDGYRDVLAFVVAYLLCSVPPFFLLRRARLSALRAELARNVVILAFVGTIVLLILALASLARTGVTRYVEFLQSPTDLLSVLVELAFLGASTSWWLVPVLEELLAVGLATEVQLAVVVALHGPLVLFLSLLTAGEYVRTHR
jgi:hypothetical protein